MCQPQKSTLQRKLKGRHIQFIALSGAVGTGLFLGVGNAIVSAGPSVLLGYLISGLVIFFIMRQLGEMDTDEPMAGSFSYFAYKYWGDFPGFLAGWNYWVLYVMIGIAELTAAAVYIQYWFPMVATWKTALFFFTIMNILNLIAVKIYGEIEFWFSIIKVTAICIMILTGCYILFINPNLVDGATVKNLWQSIGDVRTGNSIIRGFFPNGVVGFMTAMPVIIFAFGGLELIGITAAETEEPTKTIPKAVNQVVFRILFFYIGAIATLLSLYHWSNLKSNDSPFVLIFDRIGFKYTAWTLNVVVLTAALSVYNSCIYSNSRMLYGLALQKNAPKVFTETAKNGIPVKAQLLSAALTFAVVPLNYFIPRWIDAFKITVNFVVVCALVNWILITISHLKFKKQKILENHKTLFPALFYPYSNYITLIFYVFILFVMMLPQLRMTKQVIATPIWICIVYIWYKISKAKNISF
ncbi:MAG: amino acid permease [Endomicrobium sp.]|jgi:L-asparagine transporter-like permease|nr:amino acid permease [Endomicrobium sp.]